MLVLRSSFVAGILNWRCPYLLDIWEPNDGGMRPSLWTIIISQKLLDYDFLSTVLFPAVHVWRKTKLMTSSEVILVPNMTGDDDDFNSLAKGDVKVCWLRICYHKKVKTHYFIVQPVYLYHYCVLLLTDNWYLSSYTKGRDGHTSWERRDVDLKDSSRMLISNYLKKNFYHIKKNNKKKCSWCVWIQSNKTKYHKHYI